MSEPYTYERSWRPQGRPVWTNLKELLHVLSVYKRWYDAGLSDTEISARIRAQFVLPNNPQMAWKKGKR